MGIFDIFYKDNNSEGEVIDKYKNNKPLVSHEKPANFSSIPSPSFTNQSIDSQTIQSTIANNNGEQPIDPAIYDEYFKKVLMDRNEPGPDYFEFNQALHLLKSQNIEERTKFASIFAGFLAQGLTYEKLLESAKKYLSILTEKHDGFLNALKTEGTTKINEKETKVNDLKSMNITIDEQIATLTKDKIRNEKMIEEFNKQIGSDSARLKQKGVAFTSVYEKYKQEINDNITKITTYLSQIK